MNSLTLPLADAFEPKSVIDYVNAGGVVALLLMVLAGGIKQWWVFGWYYKELLGRHSALSEEKDAWKELALRSTNLAESLQELGRAKGTP
jgi:hypothetical protein